MDAVVAKFFLGFFNLLLQVGDLFLEGLVFLAKRSGPPLVGAVVTVTTGRVTRPTVIKNSAAKPTTETVALWWKFFILLTVLTSCNQR